MIKIENVDIYGWEAAIRGMRNPLESYNKSDTWFYDENVEGDIYGQSITVDPDGFPTETDVYLTDLPEEMQVKYQRYPLCIFGPNDYKLMQNLCKGGSEESKWRRFVHVTCDITAPLYFYKELDTYRVGVEKNSCSTMHKIHAKEFTLDDFSHEHLFVGDHICEAEEDGINAGAYSIEHDYDPYATTEECEDGQIPEWYECKYANDILEETIVALNYYRQKFLETKDKRYWWQTIQLLPSSYNQRRTYKFNYESLANIYRQRKNHRLDEWHQFSSWVEELPYSEFITLEAPN